MLALWGSCSFVRVTTETIDETVMGLWDAFAFVFGFINVSGCKASDWDACVRYLSMTHSFRELHLKCLIHFLKSFLSVFCGCQNNMSLA